MQLLGPEPALVLQTTSLKKYRRVHNLGDIASSSKDELIPAIQRHFAATVSHQLCQTLIVFYFLARRRQGHLRVQSALNAVSRSNIWYLPLVQVADEEETLLAFMTALQKSGPMPRPPPVQIVRPKTKGKQKR